MVGGHSGNSGVGLRIWGFFEQKIISSLDFFENALNEIRSEMNKIREDPKSP